MEISTSIVDEHGLVGHAERDLPPALVTTFARAFASWVLREGRATVVVGRDARAASGPLGDAAVRGLVAAGVRVLDLGACPTPLLRFGLRHYEVPDALMVTGGARPAAWNGIALYGAPAAGAEGAPLGPDALRDVLTFAATEELGRGSGDVLAVEIVEPYVAWLRGNVRIERALNVVVDGGGGIAGPVACRVLEQLGQNVTPLACSTEPGSAARPPGVTTADDLEELVATIHETGAEVGLAFSGDGSCLTAVTGRGRPVWGDDVAAVLARELVAARPGVPIVLDATCAPRVVAAVDAAGARVVTCAPGLRTLEQARREEQGALGATHDGALAFGDRAFGFVDAPYAAARLLESLAREKRSLDERIGERAPRSAAARLRIDPPAGVGAGEALARARESLAALGELTGVDGCLRVAWPDGAWAVLREQRPDGVLWLHLEADAADRLDALRAQVEESLEPEARAPVDG